MNIPGYRIVRELGRGGMAAVYLAEHEKIGREVALKVMAANLGEDQSFRTRFLREARNLAQTSHPNIVTVYDADVYENYHYFSMEYHTGGDLSGRLKEGVTPREALRIIREMANALARAHECGIIHRDIKPGNIMFARDDRAILTDFGIARNYGEETQLTQAGSMIGTPRYMSPEQARGLPLENASDIYSLGVVLFEMLAGTPPYQANDSVALGIKHVSAPIPDLPSELADFQPLINSLMAKEATDRPQSGQLLIKLLDEFESKLSITEKLDRRQRGKISSDNDTTWISGAHSTKEKTSALKVWPVSIASGLCILGLAIALVAPLYTPDNDTSKTPQARSEPANYSKELHSSEDVSLLLHRGNEALLDDRLMTPAGDNAVHWYQQALTLKKNDHRALTGLNQVAQRYITLARSSFAKNDTDTATKYAERARSLAPDLTELAKLDNELANADAIKKQRQKNISTLSEQLRISGLLGSALNAEEDGNYEQAKAYYQEVLNLDASNTDANTALARLEE